MNEQPFKESVSETHVTSLENTYIGRIFPALWGRYKSRPGYYIGWHYSVKNINLAPNTELVMSGMQALDETAGSIYVFTDERVWVLDEKLTKRYRSFFIA